MRPAGLSRALLVLSLVAPAASCGELDDRARFEPVVGVLEIVETIPAAGSPDADPLTRIDLCLSAEVDPRALDSFDATLHSAELTFDTQQEVQLFSWRAPGERAGLASERWCPGSVLSLTPGAPLQPGLTYRVQLRPALLGWAGEALDTEHDSWAPNAEGELRRFIEFRVAGSTGDSAPEEIPALEPGPSLTELFAPGEIFDPEREACGCHQRDDELASARLDLSDPETAWTELVLRTGLENTDFPMVTPRLPSESYLVHKLLRTQAGAGLHGLQGEPMPPDGPLPHADLVRVAHWIEAGAEL
ncbi:hypothetical protein ENSA5_25640 [Enhygromyxa salina]|uniref:SbsA Ig-like domain-containing protein n=1 Tax=Enhygromyxa salina TaxID=215803 RepID=A0A2S9YAV0_9BACT|nr:Ig-like domain-containing protein [Enhygromyxa salina]PRQ02229.1 hypothetical protein ENSA5_25640 [Enhygromyxa salina]